MKSLCYIIGMEESKWKLNGNEETKVDSKSCPMYIYHVPQSHNFNLLNYYPIPYIGAQILKEKAKVFTIYIVGSASFYAFDNLYIV